jgi:hypothetical protein
VTGLGWTIGRPIVASLGLALIGPLAGRYLFAPLFRTRRVEKAVGKGGRSAELFLGTAVLSGFLAMCVHLFLSLRESTLTRRFTVPTTRERPCSSVLSSLASSSSSSLLPTQPSTSSHAGRNLSCQSMSMCVCLLFLSFFFPYSLQPLLQILTPLFFASIGFSIPFLALWTGGRIWRGIVYSARQDPRRSTDPACRCLCAAQHGGE